MATGSFNLSGNATRNTENVLQLHGADLAGQYFTYIDQLATKYGAPPQHA